MITWLIYIVALRLKQFKVFKLFSQSFILFFKVSLSILEDLTSVARVDCEISCKDLKLETELLSISL